MKKDFKELMIAINQVCHERQLPIDIVLEAVEVALISAYKRNFSGNHSVSAQIEPKTGKVSILTEKIVVESVQDERNEVSLSEAKAINPRVKMGELISIDSTPDGDFGRIAAQTAKQVILQRIREAERDALYNTYAEREGEIVNGTVHKIDPHQVTLSLGKVEAFLPRSEQIPTERYSEGQRLRAYVASVSKASRGPQIIVSRTHRNMLRRLLEVEVPEIYNGTVEIKSIAREAGYRSKVAVAALQEGVDPVGSCVGMRGTRIQSIVNELNGEKIDVVQWNPDLSFFIANALSPARVMNVMLNDEKGKTAVVVVPDKQLSLAIGKEGQNARLAAKLTGWRIDIKSATEAAEETMGRFEGPIVAPGESDLLVLAEEILRKQDMGTLSEAQRGAIDQAVKAGYGVDLPLPEGEEPAPADVKPPAKPKVAPAVEATPESAVEVQPAVGIPAVVEPAVEIGGEEAPELKSEPAADLSVLRFDESELEPTFVGDQVEDSLGWVTTQVETEEPVDFEQEVALQEAVWEEVEDWEEVQKAGKKKKSKRIKSKKEFDIGGDWMRGGSTDKKKKYIPPRSRGKG